MKTPGDIAFEGVTATGWVGDLLARLHGHAAFAELDPPENFRGTLRPYQLRGFSWLAFLKECGLGACLADDMGLGKTIQTLALIQREWEKDVRRPTLLICPTSVVGNWKKEAERFTPELPVLVHHGLARARGGELREETARHALVVSSYALLHRDLEALKDVEWAGVILDEAQNIKNPETKQARAARAIPAGYRIALTGTPVENNVGDLWSLMELLNSGFLGTQAEFKRSFFIPIQAERDPEAAARLKRLTGPFVLRRLKTDKTIIADLPDAKGALEASEGIKRKGVVLATSLKAGGTGLNLTRADHVFHFDRWWNPAVESQATDRAFRIGQSRRVQVRKFLCAGTLEEKIAFWRGAQSLLDAVEPVYARASSHGLDVFLGRIPLGPRDEKAGERLHPEPGVQRHPSCWLSSS